MPYTFMICVPRYSVVFRRLNNVRGHAYITRSCTFHRMCTTGFNSFDTVEILRVEFTSDLITLVIRAVSGFQDDRISVHFYVIVNG